MSHYTRVDLLKYICSIGIICIHTNPFVTVAQLDNYFLHLEPIFVAMFFIISSSLLWQKLRQDKEDAVCLRHYVSRLLILVCVWGILLLPHWLPKFIHHNKETWIAYLLPKILMNGFTQGSWFIMSLIYGVLICYLLNKYLNRHLVFGLCASLWLYLSLVYYDGMPDILNIYYEKPDDSFGFESYYSPFRSLFWIEAGYYLVPSLSKYISNHTTNIVTLICLVLVGVINHGYFVADGVISILLSAWAMRDPQDVPDARFVILRQMSIVVFFFHFLLVTIIHVLFLKGMIGYEHGFTIFLAVFLISNTIAYGIIRLSKRIRILAYLY